MVSWAWSPLATWEKLVPLSKIISGQNIAFGQVYFWMDKKKFHLNVLTAINDIIRNSDKV